MHNRYYCSCFRCSCSSLLASITPWLEHNEKAAALEALWSTSASRGRPQNKEERMSRGLRKPALCLLTPCRGWYHHGAKRRINTDRQVYVREGSVVSVLLWIISKHSVYVWRLKIKQSWWKLKAQLSFIGIKYYHGHWKDKSSFFLSFGSKASFKMKLFLKEQDSKMKVTMVFFFSLKLIHRNFFLPGAP